MLATLLPGSDRSRFSSAFTGLPDLHHGHCLGMFLGTFVRIKHKDTGSDKKSALTHCGLAVFYITGSPVIHERRFCVRKAQKGCQASAR